MLAMKHHFVQMVCDGLEQAPNAFRSARPLREEANCDSVSNCRNPGGDSLFLSSASQGSLRLPAQSTGPSEAGLMSEEDDTS